MLSSVLAISLLNLPCHLALATIAYLLPSLVPYGRTASRATLKLKKSAKASSCTFSDRNEVSAKVIKLPPATAGVVLYLGANLFKVATLGLRSTESVRWKKVSMSRPTKKPPLLKLKLHTLVIGYDVVLYHKKLYVSIYNS